MVPKKYAEGMARSQNNTHIVRMLTEPSDPVDYSISKRMI